METVANPLLVSGMPYGQNPTGASVPSSVRSSGGRNPYLNNSAAPATSTGVVPSSGTTTGTGTPFVPTGATSDLISAGLPTGPVSGHGTLTGGFSGSTSDLVKGFEASGMTRQTASLLAEFLLGGAGYNPQVAQALIAQMQPSIMQGQENLMEQFSAGGGAFGSGAQIGLGDYLAKTNLDVGEILSNLYEDSVNRYIETLMGSPTQDKTPTNMDLAGSALGLASDVAGGLTNSGLKMPSGVSSVLNILAGL